MNKLMIATDIHGSCHYAKLVVQKFASSNCDKLLLLGDIYYHGPRNPLPMGYDPMSVSQLLNDLGDRLLVVKGNCDSEVDQMISTFTFCDSITVSVGSTDIVATHGHVYNKDNLPPDMHNGILVYGHYHINEIVAHGNVLAVNVGSASIPKDGHHSYCIVDDSVTLYDLLDDSVIARYSL